MLKVFSVLFLLVGCLAQSVRADEPVANPPVQKVDSASLRLLGGGIESRRTNEIIALACANEYCNELRMVYFTSTKEEAFLFGPIIPVIAKSAVPTEYEYKTTLKKVSKAYKKSKKDQHPNRLLGYCILGGQFGMIGFVQLVGLVTPATWPLFIGLGLFAVGARAIANNTVIFSKSTVTEILHDQNGWNWSLNTKKVTRKNFEAMIDLEGSETNSIQTFRR